MIFFFKFMYIHMQIKISNDQLAPNIKGTRSTETLAMAPADKF